MNTTIVVDQLRRRVPGGIGTYALGLLQGLHRVAAAPAVSLYASRGPRPDPLADLGWPVATSPLPGPLLTRAWDRGFLAVGANADVVHAVSLAAPPTRRAPLAVVVHDLSFREVPETFPPRGRRWHEAALARALAHATMFLVPSERTADGLVRAGATAAKVAVVAEGCDHLPPPDLDAARAMLRAAGVDPDAGFILTSSTLEPRKNLSRVLAAYREARPRLAAPWPLVVRGPSGWGDFDTRALPEGAVLMGPTDSPAALAGVYRLARCLVYVPLVEGFGLPPVEAMREGVPVVASAVPSVGDAALLVDAENVAAIADAIVMASSDDRARSELMARGAARASVLTWEASAARHVELWEAMA